MIEFIPAFAKLALATTVLAFSMRRSLLSPEVLASLIIVAGVPYEFLVIINREFLGQWVAASPVLSPLDQRAVFLAAHGLHAIAFVAFLIGCLLVRHRDPSSLTASKITSSSSGFVNENTVSHNERAKIRALVLIASVALVVCALAYLERVNFDLGQGRVSAKLGSAWLQKLYLVFLVLCSVFLQFAYRGRALILVVALLVATTFIVTLSRSAAFIPVWCSVVVLGISGRIDLRLLALFRFQVFFIVFAVLVLVAFADVYRKAIFMEGFDFDNFSAFFELLRRASSFDKIVSAVVYYRDHGTSLDHLLNQTFWAWIPRGFVDSKPPTNLGVFAFAYLGYGMDGGDVLRHVQGAFPLGNFWVLFAGGPIAVLVIFIVSGALTKFLFVRAESGLLWAIVLYSFVSQRAGAIVLDAGSIQGYGLLIVTTLIASVLVGANPHFGIRVRR